MLKAIKQSGETRIVLDCDFDRIGHIFKQADEIGLINEYYNYLVTNLDVERLELAPFKAQKVNITGFRMVDMSNPYLEEYVNGWNEKYGSGRGKAHPLFVSFNFQNLNYLVRKYFIFQ